MKAILSLLALLVLLFAVGCSEKSEKLTEADIHDIKVPQDFDYEMSRMVEFDFTGAYRLPLTISTPEGKLLYRGMMLPGKSMNTKINLASTVRKVVVAYHAQEITLDINGNSISHNFTNR